LKIATKEPDPTATVGSGSIFGRNHMIDRAKQETFDTAAEPPGPTLEGKPPKYFNLRRKMEKLVDFPTGELTRILGMRSSDR